MFTRGGANSQKKCFAAEAISPKENCTIQAENDAPTTTRKAGKLSKATGWVPSSNMVPTTQPIAAKTPIRFIN